ncbi:MAG: hypothetical protein JO256_02905 [Alphaproteobacteria bacterium]|nr:hypothetical protein [Alphaproteobacteria bacterium]
MAAQIHYEVFRRIGPKGGWTLHEASTSRDGAIKMAQELMKGEKPAAGVKVVKETYNDETGDFLSLKIFEDGLNKVKVDVKAEDAPNALPCFKPDDLYSYHARSVIGRLLSDFLARKKVTVTELLHRADLLEKLEATGTLYQHAIQKVAVAQAATTGQPVQQIVKTLNDLSEKAIQKVYRDERAGLFPELEAEDFAALAQKLADNAAGPYVFNGAVARYLKPAGNWDEKVFRLIALMEKAPAEENPRKLLLSAVDAVIAEILAGSAALRELLGPAETLAQSLANLVELFLGKPQMVATPGGAAQGLAALTTSFAKDELPEARTAIAGRIIAEFKANRRLCPASLVEELKALRQLANRVVLGVGKHMSHDDLVAAFTLRSKRLATQEALGPYLDGVTPDEKFERLMFVEENLIGIENKRALAAFVMPLLTSAPFESHFHNPQLPLLARLQKLAQLQARVGRCGFVDVTKADICDKLDSLAVQTAARGKLFETVDARNPNHVEKAQTLLKLATTGIFTEGKLAEAARCRILSYLSKPGFLSGYMTAAKKDGEAPNAEKVMADLMASLGKIGITAETGLKSIAA